MPYYAHLTSLPEDIQGALPLHAQVIYACAFNAAWGRMFNTPMNWFDREDTARQEAWAAVKELYQKDEQTGQWRAKGYPLPRPASQEIGAQNALLP